VKLVFLTTEDPIFLPRFFRRVLARRAGDIAAVYIVPPLYRDQSAGQAARRYARTFGVADTVRLVQRTLGAKARGHSIASVCAAHGVRCERVRDVNDARCLAALSGLAPDVAVSVSCPQIFKRNLLEIPRLGVLNVHGALLPHYRGVMPSFWMLANGEEQAGVSVYFVNEQIDAGDLCGQRAFSIAADDTLEQFLHRSKAVAAELVLDVLERLERGGIERRPLDLSKGSYFSWPTPDDVKRLRAAGRRVW
jgi:methionyl-tRNA formyltransferase